MSRKTTRDARRRWEKYKTALLAEQRKRIRELRDKGLVLGPPNWMNCLIDSDLCVLHKTYWVEGNKRTGERPRLALQTWVKQEDLAAARALSDMVHDELSNMFYAGLEGEKT